MSATFLERYRIAFGQQSALLLRLAGLLEGEVSGRGAWVEDAAGRRWLDFGSFGIHLLGHCHPAVVAAIRDQVEHFGLSTRILGNRAALHCASDLLEIAPAGLDRVLFANSGAEAVEFALRMAIHATDRAGLFAFRRSYHGKTAGALAVSDTRRTATPPAHDVHFLDPDDPAAALGAIANGKRAAVIVEPVQGEGGIRPFSEGTLRQLREACAQSGTLFILDEIQTGLGRCGSIWRSATSTPPDVLLAGKTLGGGMVPLSAVLYRAGCFGPAASDPLNHSSSYAGGAIAAAAGRAVVRTVRSDAFLAGLGERSKQLERGLRALNHPAVRSVRGEGLMFGVELQTPALTAHVIIEAVARGLLVSFCLRAPEVVRIYPPAVCSAGEIQEGIERLAAALDAAHKKGTDPHDERRSPSCPS